MLTSSDNTTAARGVSEYRDALSASSVGRLGSSSSQTVASAGSSSETRVWPCEVSISARPRRMLGSVATMLTFDNSVARADGHAHFLQLATAHNGRADRRANLGGREDALEIVGIADRRAVELDEDVALQHARGRGRAAVGDLYHEQTALLAASQVFGLLRKRHG